MAAHLSLSLALLLPPHGAFRHMPSSLYGLHLPSPPPAAAPRTAASRFGARPLEDTELYLLCLSCFVHLDGWDCVLDAKLWEEAGGGGVGIGCCVRTGHHCCPVLRRCQILCKAEANISSNLPESVPTGASQYEKIVELLTPLYPVWVILGTIIGIYKPLMVTWLETVLYFFSLLA